MVSPVGGGGGVSVTVTGQLLVPPGPMTVPEKVFVAETFTVFVPPVVATLVPSRVAVVTVP